MKKRCIVFVVILGVFLCFMGSNVKYEKQQKFVLASGIGLKKILLGEKAGGIVKNAAFIINAVREGEKDTTNEEIVIERIDKSIENEKGEVLGIAYYDKPVIVTSDSEGIKKINAFYEEEAKEWFGSGGKITANVENYYEYFCESLEEMKEIWGEEVLVDNPLHYRVDTQIEYVDNNTISIFQIVDVLIGTRGWLYYGNTFDLNTGELIPITDLVEIDAEGLQKIMLDGAKGSWNQVDYTCLKGNNYSVKYYDTEIDMRYAYFFDGKNFYFTDNLSGHDGKLIKWNGEWGSNYEVEVLDEENKRLSARETLRYLFDNLYTADDKSTMEELEVCDTQEALYYKYKFKRSTGEISDPYILYYMHTTEDEKYHKFELYGEIWDNIYREEGITREYARNSHSNYWYIDTKSKEIIPQWIYNPDAEDDASYCTYNEKYYEIDKTYDGGEFRNSEIDAETISLAEAIGETVVILEGDFYQKMDANPIDSYFIFEDAATESRIMRAGQYYNAWIDEIDNSMIVLKDYLSEEDYLLLESSYTGWKQYVESTMDIEQSIFYIGSDYMENSLFAGAGLTYPRVMEVNAIRARNYAIELKALEYTFTENIEFVFDSENMEKEFDENIASEKREKLAEQIKRGDFSDTKDSDLVDTTELEEVYKNISQNTEWLCVDLNGDSIRDLIWLEYAENIPRIVGIFDMNDKGKCVYWDIMDYTEFFFIADNKQLVRYSQYFGFYDYVSYEQYNYNKNWDKNILEGAYAYNLYEVEIPYWLDEHNHDDMKEVGVYFKCFRNGIEMSIEKNDFQILYEKITGNDYRDIQKNSDLFWLY